MTNANEIRRVCKENGVLSGSRNKEEDQTPQLTTPSKAFV